MPIRIPKDLPASQTLQNENIFVMDSERATTQDIRPLRILILNLMNIKHSTIEVRDSTILLFKFIIVSWRIQSLMEQVN